MQAGFVGDDEPVRLAAVVQGTPPTASLRESCCARRSTRPRSIEPDAVVDTLIRATSWLPNTSRSVRSISTR